MTSACSANASASARRPAPSARAIADDMPPPMAPADIICISISDGKHQRDAGQRIGAELADEIGFDQPDRSLREHHQHVRRGEPNERCRDRPLDQCAGARVVAGFFGRGDGWRGRRAVRRRQGSARTCGRSHRLSRARPLNNRAYRSIYAYIKRQREYKERDVFRYDESCSLQLPGAAPGRAACHAIL